jgi:hypothetical protein
MNLLNRGLKEKRASAGVRALASRLAPFGGSNITSGIAYTLPAGLLGGSLSLAALQGLHLPKEMIVPFIDTGVLAGGLTGKLIKDYRTRSIARSLSPREAQEVLRLRPGMGTEELVAGGIYGSSPILERIPAFSQGLSGRDQLLNAAFSGSELYTNRAVMRELQRKAGLR